MVSSTSKPAATAASTPTTAAGTEYPKALPAPSVPRLIADQLSEAWGNIAIVADAQINIWTMKIVRVIVLGAMALPALLAAVALIVYGFILLDRAFAYALVQNLPEWASPLIRGALYFGIPMGVLASVWVSNVGTPDANESAEEKAKKKNEVRNAQL